MHESVAGCVSVDESSVVVSKDERGVKRDARVRQGLDMHAFASE